MTARSHRILQWAFVFCILMAVPAIRFSIGALPTDDGLRHAAQAVSGRPWTDVTFIRPDCLMDHNPGWNWLLAEVHRLTGMDQMGILYLSVYGLLAIYHLVGLGVSPAPLFWMASIAIFYASGEIAIVGRLLHGRPFELSMACWLLALHLWSKPVLSRKDAWLTALMCCLCTSVHGTWYPWAALGLGLAASRQWRRAVLFGTVFSLGVLAGAALTGHPFDFLWNSLRILGRLEGEKLPASLLQIEALPWFVRWQTLIPVAALLYLSRLVRASISEKERRLIPVLVICLGLGLMNFRMWADWGLPCLTLLGALRLKLIVDAVHLRLDGWRMSIATGCCCLAWLAGAALSGTMFYVPTSSTWSKDTPAAWLPEKGGVVYNHSISSFCQTYFYHPDMNWKMAIGFEYSFAPAEEYDTFLRLAASPKAYADAVAEKMTEKDRILLNMAAPPQTAKLIWFRAGDFVWLGKLRQK